MSLPTPYYQDEWVTLYHSDCREILPLFPDKHFDLCLTDPPYGLNFNNGDLAHNREKVFGGRVENMRARPIANDGEDEANALFVAFLKEAKRILKRGSCCCGGGPKPLFARWTLWMDEYIGFKQAIVWDKGGLGMGLHYRRNYEFMLVAQKGAPAHRWNGGNSTPNVVRISKIIPSEREHPTEKPVELMEHFVRLHSDEDDILLDPFAGRGSTLVAAKKLKRRAVGIEIEEKYCEDIVNRLNSPLPLFENKQEGLAL